MIFSIIFWILGGSALLWIVLFNVLGVAWMFSKVKKLLFGNKKPAKEENNPS